MLNKYGHGVDAVQNFAFGGIANPTQVATLRGADKAYLDARQKELDEFEAQRQAYNDSLTKWQNEVYNPYKSQVSEYNAASQKYNTDVYEPYKSQVNAYNTASQKYNTDVYEPYKGQVDAYNAALQQYNTDVYSPFQEKYKQYEKEMQVWQGGDQISGTAPIAPKLSSEFTLATPTTPTAFGMTAPTTPTAFGMTAPTTPGEFKGTAPGLPFKEEEVVAYQQEAAERARQDAGQRALALDVVSNPDQFNFGSLSVSSQFMAEGGEVKLDEEPEETINTDPVGSAKKMLEDLGSLGQTDYSASPTLQSVKRTRTAPVRGESGKGMKMGYDSLTKGDLGSPKDLKPGAREGDSARAQMEELARVYQLKARGAQDKGRGLMSGTFNASTLDSPSLTKGKLTKKRFNKGGEAKKPEEGKKTESSGFFSNLFKGSDDNFIKDIKSKAEKNEDYRAMLEYLQSRDAVPEIKEGRYLPDKVDAAFSGMKLPFVGAIGSGTIKLNKENIVSPYHKGDIGPSTLAHEMAHATDRQLEEQDRKQGGIFSKGNKFTEAYEKMIGSGGLLGGGGMRSGEKRTDLARKLQPEWASNPIVKEYRALPYELAAHGVGRYAGPTTAESAPPHVDATAATEFQILLDLARRNSGAAVKRADGSPEEGELSQEEIDAASKPAFVTPKSGKGRKEGPISKQLRSGDAYVNMAKGLTEMPYNLAGAPMDMVMLARQGLTGQAPAGQVGTSDYIKSKMTAAGVRPEPPADPTAKGFYTAGDLLSNLVNPAGVTRAGVKGAEKVGQAATDVAKDFQQYNQQLSVPGASYAVRPTGSTMLTGPVGLNQEVSEIDSLVRNGMANSRHVAGQNEGQKGLLKDFWDKKARNYFTRQFGTPDDPIAKGIADKTIKGTALEGTFPGYMVDQIAVGKTRYKEGATPEGFVGPGAPVKDRFFPKYPQAMEDLTKRYDEATGIKGSLITADPAASDPKYNNLISDAGKSMARRSSDLETDKMITQGIDPRLINNEVGTVTRSAADPSVIASEGTVSAKDLYKAFEESSAYNKLSPKQKTAYANDMLGKGRPVAGMDETEVGNNLLSENVRTAIEKGEPIYDINYLRKPLSELFNPLHINTYLASLPPRELANIRFEDAVRGALKMRENSAQLENLAARIKAGKPVPDKVFSDGVSKPLLQFDKDSGFDGFAWKQIETRAATVPEGAYVGHSVGGYELGGPTYTKEKMEGFNTGQYRVYTLRDNRNRPVNTIEVKMEDEGAGRLVPVVKQIKGNGRATGNVPAAKYDGAILRFLATYIKPSTITEEDKFLTPLLKSYQQELLVARTAEIDKQRRQAGFR